MTNDDLVRQLVFDTCSKNPAMVQATIEAATEGVKEFAKKQNDAASQMAFVMSQILDQYPTGDFGPFTRVNILDIIEPWLGGTAWMKRQRDGLTITA